MNRHRTRPAWIAQRERPLNAFERIDEFLERHRQGCSPEAINRVRRALFGELPEEEMRPLTENPALAEATTEIQEMT